METLKILCVCDMVINEDVMKEMKGLERFGAEVSFLKDMQMQSPKDITEVMIKTEQEGADACPANPDLVHAVKDVDILVIHVSPVNTQVLSAAEKLKVVGVLRGGCENVNMKLAEERGIKVLNSPGRSSHAVADFTVGMMLAEVKNIAKGHRGLYEGKWIKKFPNFNYCHDLRNCTVGIIGFGSIGEKVAQRLRGFGCRIIACDPYLTPEQIREKGAEAVTPKALLAESDFVTIHLRLSEQSHHFMGKKEFALMKKTAYFINTARAGLVDEEALLNALRNKEIGGAAIDVFNEEPLPAANPYIELDNVTITPHVAGTSCDTFTNSVEIMKNQLISYFENKVIQ